VLDERGPADDPEYVYVYVPERMWLRRSGIRRLRKRFSTP
jgi:hypothetical protein